jgi:hypothetical protein
MLFFRSLFTVTASYFHFMGLWSSLSCGIIVYLNYFKYQQSGIEDKWTFFCIITWKNIIKPIISLEQVFGLNCQWGGQILKWSNQSFFEKFGSVELTPAIQYSETKYEEWHFARWVWEMSCWYIAADGTNKVRAEVDSKGSEIFIKT